jgi:conjugal transfer pilus assembly protein TraV
MIFYKKITAPLLFLAVSGLTGCTVGQSDFNCSAGDENALCGSSRTIYHATDGDLQENETITFIEDGETRQVSLNELKKIKGGAVSEKKTSVSESSHNAVPFSFSYDGNVLRKDVEVMRIWIAPWVDKSDDLHLSTLFYTDIEKRKWEVGSIEPDAGPRSGAKPFLANSGTKAATVVESKNKPKKASKFSK